MNRKILAPWVFLALLVAIALGCQRTETVEPDEPSPPPLFADVTDALGISFHHEAGRFGTFFMPQIIGSGAALLDYDQDGRLDIYLLNNAGPRSTAKNCLLHQEKDGKFRDVSEGSGLDVIGFGMGVAVGDVNNDGWPDVLVTQYGDGTLLFLNNGNGTFTNVTREAGLDDRLWGTSASWLDYDRDGWLDLVVVHYVDYGPGRPCTDMSGRPDYCAPQLFAGTVTTLFHNVSKRTEDGSVRVRFEDVTLRSGLGARPGPGLGVACADFDGDGWQDILVANDGKPNHLWINQKNGTFHEDALARGIALNAQGLPLANMGVVLGDVDGDLRFDVFIPHLTEEPPALWRQEKRGLFRDIAASAGLAVPLRRGTGFGAVLEDFDDDGAIDVAVVNGRVMASHSTRNVIVVNRGERRDFLSTYAERNQLFVNDGKGGFNDVSLANPDFCGTEGVYRALACGDIDGDGAVDLLVTSVSGPARLFRNVAPKRGHWLSVRVVDPQLKRDAYGAEVTVFAGQKHFKRWANPGYSFLCSNDPCLHFGLGEAEAVDALEVVWPNGDRERFDGCPADRAVELRKGHPQPVPRTRSK
jgi:hypothetical protein